MDTSNISEDDKKKLEKLGTLNVIRTELLKEKSKRRSSFAQDKNTLKNALLKANLEPKVLFQDYQIG